jgi:Lon protease-like protein
MSTDKGKENNEEQDKNNEILRKSKSENKSVSVSENVSEGSSRESNGGHGVGLDADVTASASSSIQSSISVSPSQSSNDSSTNSQTSSNPKNSSLGTNSLLPMLPIRDLVVYPYMILPLFVGREASIQAVENAIQHHDRMIILVSQKDIQTEKPSIEDLYQVGTAAMIMRMRKLADGRVKILIQGLHKVTILEVDDKGPFYKCQTNKIEQLAQNIDKVFLQAITKNVKEKLEKLVSFGQNISPDILLVLEDIEDPGRLADLIASNLHLKVSLTACSTKLC